MRLCKLKKYFVLAMVLLTIFMALFFYLGKTSPVLASDIPAFSPDEWDFDLIGSGVGWLKLGNQLYLTENNGQSWDEISPELSESQSLEDLSFLDHNLGYALIFSPAEPNWQLRLLETRDTGKSWQSLPTDLSQSLGSLTELPLDKVRIQWLTPYEAWVLVKLATGSNFSEGVLLRTRDAGKTWQKAEAPAGEEFVFLSSQLGYMLDPFNSDKIFETQDGGESWQSLSLEPSELESGGITTLASPTFVQELEEAIDQEISQSGMALSQIKSQDGEEIWAGMQGGQCDQPGAELESDYINCTQSFGLYSSKDSGQTWQPLSLPEAFNESTQLQTTVIPTQSMETLPQSGETDWIQKYLGHAFDTCEIPTLSKLQTWFNASPYQVVNLYIGGISRACDNEALTSAYLQQMFNQGWRFIPTWVGPQAPCTDFKNKFPVDIEDAYAAGVDNANQAKETLLELGLTNPDGSGSIVYYDLEYFSYTESCSAAARAFIDGWTTRLHQLGLLSGLYATSRNLVQNQVYTIQPPPDAVWIAEWYRDYYYRPDETVWDVLWLPEIYWVNRQRVYQYTGGHNETWGGVTINIDNDVLDGPVAAPYGSDLIAPVTSFSKSGTMGISPWYKTPVTITLSASDNEEGVKHTYFRINTGSWQLYAGPFTVSGSGLKTVTYLSVDKVNNWETPKSLSFYVDSLAPINPKVTNTGCEAFNGLPQAYCNDPWFTWGGASDSGVGLDETDTYEYYWGTNASATAGTRTTAVQLDPLPIPTRVPYYLRIRTQDKHGKWSAWQTIYTLIYDPSFIYQLRLPLVFQK